MKADIRVGAQTVPIDSVRPYEGNARLGDVHAIAESLRVNGQYRPIVCSSRTREIIAGTHTWKACKSLGWRTVAVTFLDVEDAEALAIMLKDNRTSDLSRTDDVRALAILEALPSLEGTTYTAADVALMSYAGPVDAGTPDPSEREADTGMDAPPTKGVPIQVGALRCQITDSAYDGWRADLPRRNADAVPEVLRMLGLTEPDLPRGQSTRVAFAEPETVGIETLVPYPGNPQEGDISAIAESLTAFGQYRPAIVSKRTRRVLVGNHMIAAAVDLGWRDIGVAYVDVDEDGERRILLADNHTAALAGYDEEALHALVSTVAGLGVLHVSGWDLEDLDSPLQPGTPERDARVRVGSLKATVRVALVRRAALDVPKILARLGISPSARVEHTFD